MAYAAYRDDLAFSVRSSVVATQIHVLDVVVSCADACRVRRAVARCPGAGVVRCEVLLNERSSTENDAPRVRLMVRMALSSYAQVVHALLEAVPSGELGRLVSWRNHLQRCGLRYGH